MVENPKKSTCLHIWQKDEKHVILNVFINNAHR